MSFPYIPPPFPFPEAWPRLFQTPQTTWLSPRITTLPFPPSLLYSQGLHDGANVYGAPHPSAPPFATFPPSESSNLITRGEQTHDDDTQRSEDASQHSNSDANSSNSDAADDDGEYVYGYVLSDEWRGRFRNSLQVRHRQQQQQRSQRQREQRAAAKGNQPAAKQSNTHKAKLRKQQHFLSASDQRAMDLQRELAAAKQRETTQRRPQERGTAPSSQAAQDVRRLETQLNLRFDAFCDAFLPVMWPHDAVHK